MDPNIKQDPNGICSLNSFLNKIYKAIPNIEPKKRIIEREKGQRQIFQQLLKKNSHVYLMQVELVL